jgi:hypothetical protein
MIRQLGQVRRQLVIGAGFLREEKLRHDPHVGFDRDHAPRRGRSVPGDCPQRRPHGLQHRQRDGDTGAAQEGAS